jgi:D-arginine dehydrogenase
MLHAGAVVIANGAWAETLGATADLGLSLRPLRRHLVLLATERSFRPTRPIVWDLERSAYFRPESGAILASPCDAEPWPPELPPADPAALELLGQKLAQVAPLIARGRVVRSWACLRTFAPDDLPVIGPDPRAPGLYWLAGLGGSGMGLAAAAGVP